MSIESGLFHYAICDECGERAQLSDETGYAVAESAEEMRQAVTDGGGRVVDGVVTCAGCCEEALT